MTANGRSPRPNGSARKRSPAKPKTADSPTQETTAGPPEPAVFFPANIHPVDAEMWPVQPVIWLQSEWRPGLPAASGLHIERHHKIPIPGFLNVAAGRGWGHCSAGGLAAGLSSPPPLLPKVGLTPPESDLTLLGWDPRTVVPGSAGGLAAGPLTGKTGSAPGGGK